MDRGSKAWAPHGEHGWVAVEVVGVEGDRARVRLVLADERWSRAARRTVPLARLVARDPARKRADHPGAEPCVYRFEAGLPRAPRAAAPVRPALPLPARAPEASSPWGAAPPRVRSGTGPLRFD